MAPPHTPPTKIISSTPLSSAQAHTFLTSFTAAAEASRSDVHNGHNEIVFTNLKRIEQALIGIHVPRPVQSDLELEGLTDMAAPIVEEIVPVEGEGEEQEGENRENGKDDIDALREGGDEGEVGNRGIPAIQAGVKGRADKKADKKARRKEEKKQRAEQRKKGKGEEIDSDGSQ